MVRRKEGKCVFVAGTLGYKGILTGVCRKEGARHPIHTVGERPKEKRMCAMEGTLWEGERGESVCICTIES